MSEKKWVQHASGSGDKFEVQSECVGYWVVRRGLDAVETLLTKMDYVLCEPPEEWRAIGVAYVAVQVIDVRGQYLPGEYRIRMTGVEQKVSR